MYFTKSQYSFLLINLNNEDFQRNVQNTSICVRCNDITKSGKSEDNSHPNAAELGISYF